MTNNKRLEEVKKIMAIGKLGDFRLRNYIGSGAFGHVFEGISPTEETVALKFPIKEGGIRALKEETRISSAIHETSPLLGIPKMVFWESEPPFVTMNLLGKSLETKLQEIPCKRFRLKWILILTIQLLDILEALHNKGYVHRDIKPENLVMGGKDDPNSIYCIDLGLSKKMGPYRSGLGFVGTARFAPLAAHKGIEQRGKDDLESVVYTMVYLFKGKLPWNSIGLTTKEERYKAIHLLKEKTNEEQLCTGMPREYTLLLRYIRTLPFKETPDYGVWRTAFKRLLRSRNYNNHDLFE